MKTSITVKNRVQAEAVQLAMTDPQVRAFVLIMGALMQLPSDRARARVLNFVADRASDPDCYPDDRVEEVVPQ